MKSLRDSRIRWFLQNGQRVALVLVCADLIRRLLCSLIDGSEFTNPPIGSGEGAWPTLTCGAAILLALLRFGDPIVADRQTVFGVKRSPERAGE